MAPTVSVCIPTLGRASLVSTALPSVFAEPEAAAGQVEVLLAVDPTTPPLDLPPELATEVRVLEVPWRTPGSVRNALAAASSGQVLLFLDDDDALAEGWFHTFATLLGDAEVGVACGSVRRVRPDGSAELLGPVALTPLHRGWVGRFNAGSYAVRRSLFDAVGGFDEVLPASENWELSMRLAQESERAGLRLAATDRVVLEYLWLGDEEKYHPFQAAVAARMLEVHAHLLAADPVARAGYLAQLGVGRAMLGDLPGARRALWAAVRSHPRDRAHWGRLAVCLVPPLARRRWHLERTAATAADVGSTAAR